MGTLEQIQGGSKLKYLQAFSLVLCVCSGLFAQTDRGTITGTVIDSSGAVIPGAKVVIVNNETQLRSETITTPTGNYTLAALPAGTYTLIIDQAGFSKYERTNITIQVAVTTRVDATLTRRTGSRDPCRSPPTPPCSRPRAPNSPAPSPARPSTSCQSTSASARERFAILSRSSN